MLHYQYIRGSESRGKLPLEEILASQGRQGKCHSGEKFKGDMASDRIQQTVHISDLQCVKRYIEV